MIRLLIATGMIAAAVLTLFACGGGESNQAREAQLEEYARSYGADVDVEIDDETGTKNVVVNQGLGTLSGQVGTNLQVPTDFPDDVVLYADMRVFSVTRIPQGFSLQGISDDELQAIADFYGRKMSEQGWEDATADAQLPAMRSLQFKKGERMTSVNLMPNGEHTTVQIMTMKIG